MVRGQRDILELKSLEECCLEQLKFFLRLLFIVYVLQACSYLDDLYFLFLYFVGSVANFPVKPDSISGIFHYYFCIVTIISPINFLCKVGNCTPLVKLKSMLLISFLGLDNKTIIFQKIPLI